MDFKKIEIKEIDEETGVFKGMASPYGNVDLGGDVVDKGAFKRTIQHRKGVVPLLWQHNSDDPIGVAELEDSEKGLMIQGKLNLGVAKAVEALSLLKQKAIKGLSIGYETVKKDIIDNVRHLKEINLWEVSVVTFPMNPKANVNSVKSAELAVLEEIKDGIKALRKELCGPDDSGENHSQDTNDTDELGTKDLQEGLDDLITEIRNFK